MSLANFKTTTAVEDFEAIMAKGLSYETAFAIAANILANFPDKCAEELPALAKAYRRERDKYLAKSCEETAELLREFETGGDR